MKDIYVLGVHDGHCATATLLKNGKIIASASEERFVYRKNEWGMPKNAIKYCLSYAGISSKDLDKVVLASKFMAPTIKKSYGKKGNNKNFFVKTYRTMQKLRRALYYFPSLHDYIYKKIHPRLCRKSSKERKSFLSEILGIEECKIVTQEHHLAHAYSVAYGSGFMNDKEDFLVLTLDGEGDGLCSTVNIVRNGKLKRIASTINSYSIGLLYARITEYLGMRALEHEYKVMGMAPYANPYNIKKPYELLKDIVWVEGMGFNGKYNSHIYDKVVKKKLEYQRFDGISGAIQKLTEELIITWVKNCIRKTGINKIAFSGGVFMNVKANQKILQLKELRDAFFMPSAGDESLSIGACYYGYEMLNAKKKKALPLKELYLGPKVNKEEVPKYFDKKKYNVKKLKNPEKDVAKLLSKGKIVARCSGRMEWGARALGNRSILADPSRPDVVREINEAIKSRDFWMPFAPVILDKDARKYIINPRKIKAPYMILAFDSTEKAKKDLPAASHPYDKTIRPQVIEESWNPSYYKILKEFKKITGRGALLNTSFNLHGFPIVKGVKEAHHVMDNSDLKYLLIEDYLIEKITP